jgi:outer membrane immunogenic protein
LGLRNWPNGGVCGREVTAAGARVPYIHIRFDFIFAFLGKFMKLILITATAIASLFATDAFAADLAARPYTKAPPLVDPGYNWTGFYAGLNGGYSWGRANTNITGISPFAAIFPIPAFAPFRQDVNGGIAGGQAGYNWQVDRKWVLGLEGDIQWSGERSSSLLTVVGPRYGSTIIGIAFPGPGPDFNSIITQTANLAHSLEWFATFRGRAGVLADPQTLLYATGGLAVGEFKYSAQATTTIQVFGPGLGGTTPVGTLVLPGAVAASSSDTRVGWTVGAGVERKFSPNWSGKLEYLYMDFGSKTFFAGTTNQADVSFHDHIFRAGFNYAFAPMAVVAKY